MNRSNGGLSLVMLLLCSRMAWGGLYNTVEPPLGPSPTADYRSFQDALGSLRQISVERRAELGGNSPLREAYLRRVAAWRVQERHGCLTLEDRINLGEHYLRLLQPEQAVQVLASAVGPGRGNFMLLSNLATAYQLTNNLDRAELYLRQSLAAWPSTWPGLTTPQLVGYRRAETFQLALIQSRRRERTVEGVDEIFPGLRFQNEKGDYEAGGAPAPRYWDALPPDWPLVVQQLLLWLPWDDRLRWLLAELLNATGRVEDAAQILSEIVDVGSLSARELRRHRQVLLEARPLARRWASDVGVAEKAELLWALTPRGDAGVGSLPAEVGPLLALELRRPGSALLEPKGGEPERAPTATKPAAGESDAKHLLVAFGAGALTALFLGWQVKEIRRRQRLAAQRH